MPNANRPTADFIRYVLPRFPVMSPQAANNLKHNRYFQYLIMLLNELFITPGQIRAGCCGFSLSILQLFISRQKDNCYAETVAELQLRILTCIYFLQKDLLVEAKPHIDRALELVLEYTLEFLRELAPWKQVDVILGNGLREYLQHLPQEFTQSIKECVEILIIQQRKRNLEVDFLRQKHQLSTEDIRNRLYEELYHTTLWKDARSAFLESSVHNMSALLKMRAEIEFLWPIFSRVKTSVNMRKEIWNIINFLGRLTAYIIRSQSGPFPDRMQSFQKECDYLFEILQLYYTIGPYTFQSTTCKSEFTVASMLKTQDLL
ncbi:hypothetical protein V8C35DRAFT_332961 [Trichoderma chlorosporum]